MAADGWESDGAAVAGRRRNHVSTSPPAINPTGTAGTAGKSTSLHDQFTAHADLAMAGERAEVRMPARLHGGVEHHLTGLVRTTSAIAASTSPLSAAGR